MRTIFADFNALTGAEHVRLTTRGSLDDIQKSGVQPGEWIWLSDGELQVGAKIVEDPTFRLLGIPAWETLVHLQDQEDRDFGDLFSELEHLFERTRTPQDESRLLQVITWLETKASDDARSVFGPGFFDFRRAGALLELGRIELALLAIEEAVRAQPAKDAYVYFYLELLKRTDLDRALVEARHRVLDSQSSATVIAACINILATYAERLTGNERTSVCTQVLEWSRKFEEAPARDRVLASTLSQVDLIVGLTLLQLGRVDEARSRFHAAHSADPQDSTTTDALALAAYDDQARAIASRIRERRPAA